MHPYRQQPDKAFWSKTVAVQSGPDLNQLWDPKFHVRPETRVSAFGSCFAQHFGRALEAKGYNWLRTEPPPVGMSDTAQRAFGYNVFSARTGNIYTTSLLRQWVSWAAGNQEMPEEVWQSNGRFFDPFRPRIEPDGFASLEELRQSQKVAVAAFARSILRADIFVFTLGLTERWVNRKHGYEYPMCPGTAAGDFDADLHEFSNMGFMQVQKNLIEAIKMMREMRKKRGKSLKVILTVSPVPLVATATAQHVLTATTYSKSVLRAVAGSMAERFEKVDYFPSYEIISSAPMGAEYFEDDLRNVKEEGVSRVMQVFFDCQSRKFGAQPAPTQAKEPIAASGSDLVCEEILLDAFSGRPAGD